MILLIAFSFLAGFVTILSPCILPILPVVLSGSLTGGHKRPIGIVTGFVLSFSLFTLFLSAIVKLTGISADVLRNLSVVIILLFGVSLLLPNFQILMEKLFTKLASKVSSRPNGSGFFGGLILGVSLGLVWTPCVGPIIASVITLAATNSVNGSAILITFAYSLGTAIPMLAIIFGGRTLLQKVPWLLKNTGNIQRAFGILMILVAFMIFLGLDRKFQTVVLDMFPSYGEGLIKLEDNEIVKKELEMTTSGKGLLEKMVNSTYPMAPELVQGGEWINSNPLTLQSLKGKVVLIDFWTYTCINCIRTLPYLKDWYQKYEDDGFVIIGVHTPEFEFEKDIENVREAVSDFGLKYPVMQDNDYGTWSAYNNRYWPAHYLIDKDGKVRYTHFGEGEYDKTEQTIQKLLNEAGAKVTDAISNEDYSIDTQTPETYLGYARMKGLSSPEILKHNIQQNYSIPKSLSLNSFAFEGKWNVKEENATANEGAAIEYEYIAKNVFLVMSPVGEEAKVAVFLDGKVVEELSVDSNRLYELVKLEKAGQHRLRVEIIEGEVSFYAFTFG